MLKYNLINSSLHLPGTWPLEFVAEQEELEQILLSWKDLIRKEHSQCPNLLVYMLDHLYTEPNLSSSSLKGGDRLIGSCLSELCEQYGFSFYFGRAKKVIEGRCEEAANENDPDVHQITVIHNERLALKSISDATGKKLLDRAPLKRSQLINENTFTAGPIRQEDFSPSTHRGFEATQVYRGSVSYTCPAEVSAFICE